MMELSVLGAPWPVGLRALAAGWTAFGLTMASLPLWISYLNKRQLQQPIRKLGPQRHQIKAGTPAMGGLPLIASILAASLLWGQWRLALLWPLLVMAVYAAIGALDDMHKLSTRHTDGLSARRKYLWQTAAALMAATLWFGAQPEHAGRILLLVGPLWIPVGIGFILWANLVIVGSSNAVNLTDGLDGLAVLCTIAVACGLLIAAIIGFHLLPDHPALSWAYRPGNRETCILCSSVIGSGLGFLWFNTYPARIFMGDVGSLGLGALLGAIALALHMELLLVIMGGVFVAETLSVILQVGCFKLTGKRIFRMAPLHHHFELKGWPETHVVARFWIINMILISTGLFLLWLRLYGSS